ncbi:substrate-binding domain-containing protein [Methanospirillum hungatei]|uniref:substrate-binding domain-containing protein n=1 Tax=Methanospirillum hungatei TaxID=2203 RepID=UPI0026ED0833|nr:substrate-binding domain-containing protein [Methanospirillum hungatei]MCA1915272.1 substrate-binding domain-containing protein [Methanospirillum hungatei]
MRFVFTGFLLLLSLMGWFVSADTASHDLQVLYPVSIETQVEGYIELFKDKYPDIPVIPVKTNGTGDLVSLVQNNESGYDVLIVPDYVSFEKGLMPSYITWDIRYGNCAMVLSYTPESAYADMITSENWYDVLSQEKVTTAIVHPDADARGWRSLVTLSLADDHYEKPIFETIIPPESGITRMESENGTIVSAVNPHSHGNFLVLNTTTEAFDYTKNSTVDYTLNYQGGAYQHGLSMINLPEEIDLSIPEFQENYWSVGVETGSGMKHSPPIVFAVSIPTNAQNRDAGIDFIRLILSEEGKEVLRGLGQDPIRPAEGFGDVPPELGSLVSLG